MLPSTLTLALLTPVSFAQIFVFSCQNATGPCNNACYAFNGGLASGSLTYDSNTTDYAQRRTLSGCGNYPCAVGRPRHFYGNTCDTYPFSSVQEGGAGAVLRCVSNNDEYGKNNQLSAFYTTIPNGTVFKVGVRQFQNAPYCANANNHYNDGDEFHLSNGALVPVQASKHRRDSEKRQNLHEDLISRGTQDDFETAARIKSATPRKFLDSEGDTVLILTNDKDSPLVGNEAFVDGRSIKLVKEIL